jgi:hypothetical protein
MRRSAQAHRLRRARDLGSGNASYGCAASCAPAAVGAAREALAERIVMGQHPANARANASASNGPRTSNATDWFQWPGCTSSAKKRCCAGVSTRGRRGGLTGTGVAAGVTPTASVFATRRGDGRRIEQLLRREAHAELARGR